MCDVMLTLELRKKSLTGICIKCPRFTLIEMRISLDRRATEWKERMRKDAPLAVERVSVAVLVGLEANEDVGARPRNACEGQWGHIGPNLKE